MLFTDEEKLEEMVRRALKEELETVLNRSGKIMDFIIGTALKTEKEVLQKEKEAVLAQREAKREAEPPKKSKFLYSMQELADFLHCSVVTAQKIKNSGHIPYQQAGRKLLFDTDAVLKALEQKRR